MRKKQIALLIAMLCIACLVFGACASDEGTASSERSAEPSESSYTETTTEALQISSGDTSEVSESSEVSDTSDGEPVYYYEDIMANPNKNYLFICSDCALDKAILASIQEQSPGLQVIDLSTVIYPDGKSANDIVKAFPTQTISWGDD